MTRIPELIRNDPTRQIAIRISATDEVPAEEMLILPPMEQREYLALIQRPASEVLEDLMSRLPELEFDECATSCDIRLYDSLPLIGRKLKAKWHTVGNEATGPTPEAVAKSTLALNMGRQPTGAEFAEYRQRFPVPQVQPRQTEMIL